MSWQPGQDPIPGDRLSCDAIEHVIVPRARDLGGFEVRRALPSAQKQMIGPFIFFDQMGPAEFLIGGGIDERVQPTLPEAANFNFAPYIRPPKLLLNGRDDEEHPWFTRALPLWTLLREPKQLVLVPGGGHIPPLEARVPAINRFLDQVLGPVRRVSTQ